ncbi:MAG: hypothetical protein FJ288_16100 [Planctomycetes bacterium]|nr:hypothetical protein [Planctomycetota bacterium]
MNLDDTIVAVSSPAGAGERAILRLSGPRALQIADLAFAPGSPGRRRGKPGAGDNTTPASRRGLVTAATFTAVAGRLQAPGSPGRRRGKPCAGLSVPATAYVMRRPRSYTRQDVVEFHVGSWPALLGDLVAGLAAAGARPAEPGEFTFRAFVNGRLDLAQAEAVMAVVSAATDAALRAAGDLLSGHLSGEVGRLAEAVRETLALVEAGLDFSDQDIELAPPAEVAARVSRCGQALADLGRRSRGLETARGRVRLVLAGRPNAGKSSLFNRLLAEDRAIVLPEAGTTRDELRAALHAGGLEFTLSDIAGIDEHALLLPAGAGRHAPGGPDAEDADAQADDADAKARANALEAVGRADLVILCLDATAPTYEGMEELLDLVAVPLVVAVTKCDLAPPERALDWLACAAGKAAPESVATSAVTGGGLEDLRAALVKAVEGGAVDRQAAGPVVAARHRAAMEQAAAALARASRLARRSDGAGELVALELREALGALGTIVGRRLDAGVLDIIFSRFCIGK